MMGDILEVPGAAAFDAYVTGVMTKRVTIRELRDSIVAQTKKQTDRELALDVLKERFGDSKTIRALKACLSNDRKQLVRKQRRLHALQQRVVQCERMVLHLINRIHDVHSGESLISQWLADHHTMTASKAPFAADVVTGGHDVHGISSWDDNRYEDCTAWSRQFSEQDRCASNADRCATNADRCASNAESDEEHSESWSHMAVWAVLLLWVVWVAHILS
jgi:uncharacterized coiled-coil protein SlyX